MVRSPAQWRELVEGHRSSGLSVGAYCRQHGVTSSCFYRWRRFLTGTTPASSTWTKTNGPRAGRVSDISAIDGFAAVRVVPDAAASLQTSALQPRSLQSESIRLMLAGGREMILPALMPIGRVVELAVTLEREGERAS